VVNFDGSPYRHLTVLPPCLPMPTWLSVRSFQFSLWEEIFLIAVVVLGCKGMLRRFSATTPPLATMTSSEESTRDESPLPHDVSPLFPKE